MKLFKIFILLISSSLHSSYPEEWVKQEGECLDVAIIGAGMSGIAAALGLYRMGIHNIKLFDENEKGKEGPWLTYGKMTHLRTPKEATGPCHNIPSLTFQSWFEKLYGDKAWDQLDLPSREDWGHYLNWLTAELKLPVESESHLIEIIPQSSGKLELKFTNSSVLARKVVLATGRKGFGGYEIPSFEIPSQHTSEIVDYTPLKGKKIAILGGGTSAYDAAAEALEAGAVSVDLFYRKTELPKVNKWDALAHVGMEEGFYDLPDAWKFRIVHTIEEYGTPPPEEALNRVKPFSNFHVNPGTVVIQNSFDFLILATGYKISAEAVPELKAFAHQIKLWKDAFSTNKSKVGAFPYLGPHFEFQEKYPGQAPYLKQIYCFNYGALASHGLISSSIDGITAGAERLSKGIAADFFQEQIEEFFTDLENY